MSWFTKSRVDVYRQTNFKIKNNLHLFVDCRLCDLDFMLGIRLTNQEDNAHYCSRELIVYLGRYRVGIWLEEVIS